MKIGEIGCQKCLAPCCMNPPSIKPKEKQKALDLGAELIAYEEKNECFVSVKPKDGKCPFLSEGRCSIYDRRFDACKEFECDAIGENPYELITSDEPLNTAMKFVIGKKGNRLDYIWSIDEIEKAGITLIGKKEYIRIVATRDVFVFAEIVIKSLEAHLGWRPLR